MSIIEDINKLILTGINKEGEIYKVLWGDVSFTPDPVISEPNDYNCGSICNQLEYFYEWIREVTSETLEDIPSPFILIMAYFFSKVKPFVGESIGSVLRRAMSFLVHEGDWRSETWGTPWDIKNVLGYYMDRNALYYVANMVVTDLIDNGNFENAISSEWAFSPSGDRSADESFIGDYKVDFTSINTMSQVVTGLTEGDHVLNYFSKMISGTKSGVSIQRSSDSYYWNGDPSVLAWENTLVINEKIGSVSEKYQYHDVLFNMEDSDDVTITIHKIDSDIFYIDRIQMGRLDYPAFQFVYIDPGVTVGFAAMWNTDLYPENASYINQSFMYFAQLSLTNEFYDSLVKQMASAGVYAKFSKEE